MLIPSALSYARIILRDTDIFAAVVAECRRLSLPKTLESIEYLRLKPLHGNIRLTKNCAKHRDLSHLRFFSSDMLHALFYRRTAKISA